eukprot:9337147-Alexandrium_andersonii.AAC.1
MARPEVQRGVGRACRFGMTVPVLAGAGGGLVRSGAGRLSGRKPYRWASSSPEILKRVCPRRSNEGPSAGGPKLHERT